MDIILFKTYNNQDCKSKVFALCGAGLNLCSYDDTTAGGFSSGLLAAVQ
jgi:hypothetical protein